MYFYIQKQTTTAMKNTISLQLSHPDAYFFDLTGGADGVSGFFEGDSIQQFDDVTAVEFLDAAQRCDMICQYEERMGRIWLYDGGEGQAMDAGDYIRETCDLHSSDANAILKEVFRLRLEDDLRDIRQELGAAFPDDKIFATVDADFCAAALRLAEIIQAKNPAWVKYIKTVAA